MNKSPEEIRNIIIETMLPNVPFDGWTRQSAEQAATEAGLTTDMIHAVFPDGVRDIVAHFSSWADEKMLAALQDEDIDSLKIRERIHKAVLTRLKLLEPHKEAVRLALSYWTSPLRGMGGARIVWHTADTIWNWAGDTSTDYNHYTKRSLLSGVIATTTLAWLKDDSEGMADTSDFLWRRIENVLHVGKIFGKFKKA